MTKEVKVAIFAILATIAFLVGMSYLKGRSVLGSQKFFYAHFDNVEGLTTGGKVQLFGTNVGVVQEVRLDAESKRVVVGFDLMGNIRVPADSKVVLATEGLFNTKILEISLGDSPKEAINRTTLQDSVALGLMERAQAQLGPMADQAQRILNNVGDITDQINELMKRDSKRARVAVANIEQTLANMAALTGRLNQTAKHLDGLIVGADTLVRNPHLQHTLANLHTASDSLGATAEDFRQLAKATENVMQRLDTLTASLNRGDGTAGKLLHDETLYDNLSSATLSLDRLMEDLKSNPNRYVQFSVFGRKDKDKKNKKK